MRSLARGVRENASARHRTLVVSRGAVWLWPGIALTYRRGDQIITLSAETIKFWITRLHGPDALYKECAHFIARSADHLNAGNEGAAQRALDAIGLRYLSLDGAALMDSVAKRLGIDGLDLPVRPGPRCWTAQDIDLHVSFVTRSFNRATPLAKFGAFDSLKHPRWPAGAPDSQGGRFAPANGESAQITNVGYRGDFHDFFVNYLVDLQKIGAGLAVKSVPLTTVTGLTCISDALMKPPGKPVFILEVKTGKDPTFTFNQTLCYPYAVMGNHVTSFDPRVTQLGLVPGLPFPPMEVVIMRATEPGLPFFGDIIKPDNLHEFLRKLVQTSDCC
jgi:hypothetical protein